MDRRTRKWHQTRWSAVPGQPVDEAGYPYSGGGSPLYPHTRTSVYGDETWLATLPSGLNFLAGVWLVLAPFALDYQNTGAGFNGQWNDIVLGVAIAILALVRTFAPHRVVWFSGINLVLGGWLIVAPFVLQYNAGRDATQAVTNDIVVGILVFLLALLSITGTMRARSRQAEDTSQASTGQQ